MIIVSVAGLIWCFSVCQARTHLPRSPQCEPSNAVVHFSNAYLKCISWMLFYWGMVNGTPCPKKNIHLPGSYLTKKVFTDIIKWRIFRWRDHPGLSGWSLNPMTSDLVRDPQRRRQTQTQRKRRHHEKRLCSNKARKSTATRSHKKQEWILP